MLLKLCNTTDDFDIIPDLTILMINIRIAPDQKNLHPAPLPQLLAKICILTTTDQGNLRMNINEILFFDVVLDPFAGSGTTLVSAANIKQSFRSFDISKKISKYVSKTIN
ncbi:unnamed protein product [Rotaria sp. Silwood2]|nr:unnamed protein product [Rotaria sp. Silwood2]